MRCDRQFEDLFQDFPELAEPDVLLNKEVLAHFGLLFSAFADLEAALQSCYLLWKLRQKLLSGASLTAQMWEAEHQAIEQQAFSLTFGNLLKSLQDCRELDPARAELERIKRAKDYFAHHFFREENKNMFSDKAKKQMLVALDDLRMHLRIQEGLCQEAAQAIFASLYPELSIKEEAAGYQEELKQRYGNRGQEEKIKFGWERHFGR